MNKIEKEKLIIKSDDLIKLRILNKTDVTDKYVDWMNDYEVVKFTEQRFYHHDKSKIKKFVIEKLLSENDFLFGIYSKNEHIGNIKIGPINWRYKNSEISYIIGNKDFWNQGIATKVICSILDFGFNQLKLYRITAGYYENNLSSAKVLKKCGFKIEGYNYNEIIFEGKRYNLVRVAKIIK